MSDIADKGSQVEQQLREQAIARHQGRERHLSNGVCQSCGEAIAPSRLQVNAYAQRCVECQQDHEKKERLYRV